MTNKEYWLKEGRAKINDLKAWNPSGIFPDDLLLNYFKRYDTDNIDEALGDLSDEVKDRGIIAHVNLLKRNKIVFIPSDEIKSEVIDYLQKNGIRYNVENNKIELI